MKKLTKILLATCLLAGAAATYYFTKQDDQQAVLISVTQGDLSKTVSAGGMLKPLEEVDIGAQVSGQIRQIFIKEGQRVKKGDLLVQIDPQILTSDLETAKAELNNAQANLSAKQADLKRYQLDFARERALLKSDATSRKSFDEAEARLGVIQAEIKMAKSAAETAAIKVRKAQIDLSYTQIRSPMDGVVVSLFAKTGQTLATSQAVPNLMKIANLDTMKINVKVSEADVIHIQPDMPVSFTLLGDPNRRFNARLQGVKLSPSYIDDQNSNTTTTTATASNNAIYYYANVNVPNADHYLRMGMTAGVTILLAERKNVLMLPLSAVGKAAAADEYQVTVQLSDGSRQTRTIKTGLKDNAHIEVLSGLQLNEQVVIPTQAQTDTTDDSQYSIL